MFGVFFSSLTIVVGGAVVTGVVVDVVGLVAVMVGVVVVGACSASRLRFTKRILL